MRTDEVVREISFNSSNMNSEDTSFISADDESRVSVDIGDLEMHPDIFQALKESILTSFRIMDRELKVHSGVDCFCSGTTAVTLIKQVCELRFLVVGFSR